MKEHPIYTKYLITEEGKIFNKNSGRELSQQTNEQGYKTVSIEDPFDGKWKKRKVHRLVAQTYIPNPENKPEVNHKDGDKANNNLNNLEWNTSKENKKHAWDNQYYTDIGEDHHSSLLDNITVESICKDLQEGLRNIDVSKKYGIDKDTVSNIRRGKIWKSISCKYVLDVKRNTRKSENTIKHICEMIVEGKTDKQISEILLIDIREINRIRRKDTHKSISEMYF